MPSSCDFSVSDGCAAVILCKNVFKSLSETYEALAVQISQTKLVYSKFKSCQNPSCSRYPLDLSNLDCWHLRLASDKVLNFYVHHLHWEHIKKVRTGGIITARKPISPFITVPDKLWTRPWIQFRILMSCIITAKTVHDNHYYTA